MIRWLVALFVILSWARPGQAEFLGAYDYPFVNPLVATVVSTPEAYQIDDLAPVELGVNMRERFLRLPGNEDIPEVFWYEQRGMGYGLIKQRGPAPLVILIAGTGGNFHSGKTNEVARVLNHGGFHVLSFSSPTFANFMTTALPSHVPGRMKDDAEALYNVMKLAFEDVKDEIEIEGGIHLTGYSLGGINTAFVAELDSREKYFNFDRALVLNPPVSLISSVTILDNMLDDNVENNLEVYDQLVEDIFTEFARVYTRSDFLDLSGDFVYQFFKAAEPTNVQLEIAIGLAFRLSATNMAFVSDVMTNWGYIKPRDRVLGPTSILTPYFDRGIVKNFNDFFQELYLPYFQQSDPTLTEDQAEFDASLHAIEDYLRNADNVGLITNEDDIILAPGQAEYLNDVFGDRAAIYPTGGHCGNYLQRDVAARIIGFFRQ